MPVDYVKVKKIFLEVLEQPSGQNRQIFIEEACGTDLDLRNFVMGMLEAHLKHVTPIPEGDTKYDPQAHGIKPALTPGTVLAGKYKIIELIAEGGMGSVYRASRIADMKMEVAIKVIKPGMDSQQVLARFNIERQALAIMKHENIARVLDAGMTDDRLPFIVMELVKGLTLTKFCDDSKLSVQERLELFEKICSAVQHAHQKGIVHRDLKPNNILVALYDDKPVPKVIDFGLAKALHQPLTDDDLKTRFGMFVGTWQYTAPEQAQLNNLDIDTRADIYSLGVILYELLTGSPPLDKQRLIHAAYEEVLRMIREEEPPKPSTRIHSSEQLPSIAAQRNSEPLKLEKTLRGELDWIVMKALDKDRNRRYASPNDFARDIHAYLHGGHIEAAPPSIPYKLKKFARKYRQQLIVSVLFLSLLIAGLVASSIGFYKATISEQRALVELEKDQALQHFVDGGMFAAIDPVERARLNLPLEKNLTVRQLLDRASHNLDRNKSISHPEVDARIRFIIGKAYASIGLYDAAEYQLLKSESLLSRAETKELSIAADINQQLAQNYLLKNNHIEAKKRHEQVLAYYLRTYGASDPRTITENLNIHSMKRLAAKSTEELEPVYQSALLLLNDIRGTRDNSLYVRCQTMLAEMEVSLSKPSDAMKRMEETLAFAYTALGKDHQATMALMNNMAYQLNNQGKSNEAYTIYKDLVERSQRVFDPDNPIIALYINNYGNACQRLGKKEEAEANFKKAVELFDKVSPEHFYTIVAKSNIASLRFDAGDYPAAIALYQPLLPLFVKEYGELHQRTQRILCQYSRSLSRNGKPQEAAPLVLRLAENLLSSKAKETQLLVVANDDLRSAFKKTPMPAEYEPVRVKLKEIIKRTAPDRSDLLIEVDKTE